jgi:hypothetical protein
VTRALLPDGRITYAEDVPAGDAESLVLTIPTEDWRDALDVFCASNGNAAGLYGLFRVYAINGGKRILASRGRMQDTRTGNLAALVGRVRGVACERYDVTYQPDPAIGGVWDGTKIPKLTACLYGLAPTPNAEPLAELYRFPNGAWSVSGLPTDVYSVSSTNNSGSDAWLWLFDKKTTQSPIAAQVSCPPLYVPANGLAVGAVDFGARPLKFLSGLYFDFSSSPSAFVPIVSPPGGTFRTLIEFT